MHTSSYSVL